MSYYNPYGGEGTPPPTNQQSAPRQIPGQPPPQQQSQGQTPLDPNSEWGRLYGDLERLRLQATDNEGVRRYHEAVYGSGLDQSEKDLLAGMVAYNSFGGGGSSGDSGGGGSSSGGSGGSAGGGGSAPSGGSGLNRPGGLPGSNAANNYSDPNWIMSQIAQRGLDSQSNPLYQSISRYNNSLLNPTQASPSGGTNPVLDDLYRRLGGVSFDQPVNLLTQFLGVDANGNYGGSGSGSGNGRMRWTSSGGSSSSDRDTSGGVPDTVGNQNSYFAQRIREFFDPSRLDPANDPTMQPYLDAMRQQVLESNRDLMGKMSARAEGSGRYGGSLYGKWVRDAADAAATDVANASSQALFGSRQNALAQQMEALGLINNRDLAAMQDATNRYGINSSAGASGAASAAQMELARRGQDLDAITALMGYQQGGLGSLQRLGEFNGNMQGNASNALGSLLGMDQAGWGQAANAANWMGQNYWTGQEFDFNRQQAEAEARRQAAADAFSREQWDWQRGWQDLFNEDQLMQNWLNGIATIAGMGGTSYGTSTTPGAGINTGASFLTGAIGGGMSGVDMLNKWRQSQGQR